MIKSFRKKYDNCHFRNCSSTPTYFYKKLVSGTTGLPGFEESQYGNTEGKGDGRGYPSDVLSPTNMI